MTQHTLSIAISVRLCVTGTGTRECKSASTTARGGGQRAGSDASRANDEDVQIKRFVMIASARVHARDLLLSTREPSSILSHIAPT
jgi:hypothetical protein